MNKIVEDKDMCIGQENYNKFPNFLKNKLDNKELIFPEDTKFKYEEITAFRAIKRKPDNFTPLNIEDMRSFAEIDAKEKGKIRGRKQHDSSDPRYYGVSLFTKIDKVKQELKLPKPNKKIAGGKVYMEGGPELTEKLHVCWWLYKDITFENFSICED